MPSLKITDVITGDRFRQDLGDVGQLAESIKARGLLHPIVVTPDHRLIAGARRLEACRQIGWPRIPVTVIDMADVRLGERDENVHRKDFLPSEVAAIAKALRPAEEEKAKERERAGRPSGNLPEGSRGETREIVASYCGVGARTLDKIEAVVDAAERSPRKFGHLVQKMDDTGKIDRAFRELRQAEQRAEKRARPLPPGKYAVIYADPPWAYSNSGLAQSAASQYPTMSTEAISALPIADLADDPCVLFLWATAPLLPDALAVLAAWGFGYKTCLVWIKDRAPGLGWWLNTKHELLLVGSRGKQSQPETKVDSVIIAPVTAHSRKPQEAYDLIERMYPAVGRVELFSRGKRNGWSAWGNEPDDVR